MKRNLELEMIIHGLLYSNFTIDDYELERLIKENLDLNQDEVDELIEEIAVMLENEAEVLKETMSYTIADKLQSLIEEQHNQKYPEDAPWQLHLF